MKKNIKITLFALVALLLTPTMINNSTTKVLANETNQNEVNPVDVEKANLAKEHVYINCDLNNITSNLYLPSKTIYDAQITWDSSDKKVINPYTDDKSVGKIYRPKAGKDPVTCTLTATITVNTASVSKNFECRVLPESNYTAVISKSFEEDFIKYKTGQDLANYLTWEHSGDEIATIEETVVDNNMVGQKVLDINPLPTLYKDASYKTKINLNTNSVLETYVMTTGSIAGFRIELLNNTDKVMSFGLNNDEFTSYNSETKTDEKIADRDNGVWYKLRFELDVENQIYHAFYYDWKNNGNLVEITPTSGLPLGDSSANYFRVRILTGRYEDGHIFLSKVRINETNNLPVDPETNPNREKGIGTILNYVNSYLLIEGEELNLPEFKIYNRFNKEELLAEGVDYTIEETYGELGLVNTTTTGDYVTNYKITLNVGDGNTETKYLTTYFHVDPKLATSKLSNLRIAPIVNDGDPDAEKILKITASINRKNSKVYYAAVDAGGSPLSNEDVRSATRNDIKFSGNEEILNADFQINVRGLEFNKEYDFYVITENENGISEVYVKQNISISVYNIESADDFFFMCTDPNVQTTSFRLLNDIDFADYFWAASEITRPEYTGTFDGQGFTIRNLNIVAPFKKASLFYDFAGTFKNLTFENCHLTGNESVGFIGGYGFKEAYVSNIKMVDCKIDCYSISSAGDGYYGLIFGRVEGGSKGGNVTIENVSIENGVINAPKYVGALVGNLQKVTGLTINNVYCQVTLNADNAALGLVSRVRTGTKLVVKNTYVDIDVVWAKKEVACICGHLESQLELENVVGKLTVHGLTQPTYYNTVSGRYGTSASVKFKNVGFFEVDYSDMSEDTVIPVSASLHVGDSLKFPSEGLSKEWWERNTCFSNLDTNPNWGYNEKTSTPYLRKLDVSTLSFTASEINAYIDSIGDTVDYSDRYYIKKANELLAYCSESELALVNVDKLEKAEKDYQDYISSLNSAISSSNSISSSITGGIDWTFKESEA